MTRAAFAKRALNKLHNTSRRGIMIMKSNDRVQVESSHPGFSYDLVLGLVRKGDVKVNLNESLLRLQGTVTEQDSE